MTHAFRTMIPTIFSEISGGWAETLLAELIRLDSVISGQMRICQTRQFQTTRLKLLPVSIQRHMRLESDVLLVA